MGNTQPVFNRLEVPSFGLAWLTLDDTTGESVALIPGGGGSTKSGVRNQIQIGRYIIGDSRGGFEFLKSFDTDVKDAKSVLCSGVAVGTCMNTKVVCAFLDNHCAILTVNMIGDEMILKRVVDFKADFSEDGSVNCACILPSGHIVTGGDDGICRLWAVGYIEDKEPKSSGHIWRVRELHCMNAHTGAIMDITHHPQDALVSTMLFVSFIHLCDNVLIGYRKFISSFYFLLSKYKIHYRFFLLSHYFISCVCENFFFHFVGLVTAFYFILFLIFINAIFSCVYLRYHYH